MSRNLTENQAKAVHFPNLPGNNCRHLVIEAGAGAGKTHVLSERVKHWLCDVPPPQRLSPTEYYLVTFSRAADRELRERVERRLALEAHTLQGGMGLLHVSTIDSLFTKLMECKFPTWWERAQKLPCAKGLAKIAGFAPAPQIVSESLVLEKLDRGLEALLRKTALDRARVGEAFDFVLSGGIKRGQGFSRGSREDLLKALLSEKMLSPLAPSPILAARQIHPASLWLLEEVHALAHREYGRRLLQGELTHSDRTLFLYSLLCLPKEILRNGIFEYEGEEAIPLCVKELVVDEYQDTNEIQHEILYCLVKRNNGRMVVVGDPKQSIYGFREARVDVFTRLRTTPQWFHLELIDNFRSSPPLLQEINTLSQLTLGESKNELPPPFLDSHFYDSALATQVESRALTPGLPPCEIPLDWRVLCLSVSLNAGTGKKPDQERLGNPLQIRKGFEMQTFQIWALARTILRIKKEREEAGISSSWADFAILCEKNNEVRRTAEGLAAYGIPVLSVMSKSSSRAEISTPPNRISLILVKILQGPVAKLEFYELLQCGLLFVPHEEIEHFFRRQKAPGVTSELQWLIGERQKQNPDVAPKLKESFLTAFPNIQKIVEIIREQKKVAKFQFFAAWQTLRSRLLEICPLQYRTESLFFFREMDAFAESLSGELSSRSAKRNAEQMAGRFEEEYGTALPLPARLDHWDIPTDPDELAAQNHETAKVMTVHSSKGLEWPVVVFWPSDSRADVPADFLFLKGKEKNYLKWLQTDIERLSVVQRVENPHFESEDCDLDNPEKEWYIDIQKTLELEFERQRVFYTAFTRAKSQLVLLFPKGNSKARNSVRDKLGNLKEDGSPVTDAKISGFANQALAAYCDEAFLLRKSPIRGSVPPSPWFGRDLYAERKDNARAVCFEEYGPAWYDDFTPEHEEATKSLALKRKKDVEKSNLTYVAPRSAAHVRWLEPLADLKFIPPSPELALIAPPKKPTRSRKKVDSVSALERLFHTFQGVSVRREAKSAGVRYHAAQENQTTEEEVRRISPSTLLTRSAERTFHEYEIWSATAPLLPGNSALASPKRNILDYFALIQAQKIPPELHELSCTLPDGSMMIRDLLWRTLDAAIVPVVLDFKTGQPSDENDLQMTSYLTMVDNLTKGKWLERQMGDTPAMRAPFSLGILCYDLKNVESEARAKKLFLGRYMLKIQARLE
jgi:superfamily I DNA/RNA helicase